MSEQAETLQSCGECGATIYPEHLAAHTAGMWKGKLLCPICIQEKRQLTELDASVVPAEEVGPGDLPRVGLAPDDGADATPRRAIRSFGAAGGITLHQGAGEKTDYRRPLAGGAVHATRCRTFHCKLNDASIAHMDRMINEWADARDDIEIKFATSTIGVFEGKHADPNLIVTVFY